MSFPVFLKKFPFHFILVVLFFLLHGYSENVGLIPFIDLLIFFIVAIAAGFVLYFIFKKLVRLSGNAGITTSVLFLFYLFFGSIKDALKPGILYPFSRYTILIPSMLLILAALVFFFRKGRKEFPRLTMFINSLLLVYLVIDTATILIRSGQPAKQPAAIQSNFKKCDTCPKPDIYFIILDEYSGSHVLRDYFRYDNSSFEDALRRRGFFVASAPSSNYSATPVSIASIFSMDYLPAFHRKITAEDYTRSEKIVESGPVMQFVTGHGYNFRNHSIFNLAGQPGQFKTDLLPMRLKLITSKTLWNTVYKDLGWNIHARIAPGFPLLAKVLQDDYKDGNQRLLDMTFKAVTNREARPRFIYTHLLMPHWPYLFDSTGRETGINFYDKGLPRAQKENAYIQYLAYTNKVMINLADSIIGQSRGEAAIILMSDHGYREKPGKQTCSSVNNNFLSVYLPGKDYRLFYDSMSNVNLFRSVFNTLFQQQFVQLPDRCIF
ncbi:MAG TPA: sulfatase-like hydrolase/transferase [Chitinophagaceae bacterium]